MNLRFVFAWLAAPESRQRPFLEVQYHPADIRRKVRYLFLSRRQARALAFLGTGYLLFLLFSLLLLPKVIHDLGVHRFYESEVTARQTLGAELGQRVSRLEELEETSKQVSLTMAKIYLAYGFAERELAGQGGYPFVPSEVPTTIYGSIIQRGNGLETRVREQLAVLGVFLEEVQTFERLNRSLVQTTPSILPLRREDDFVLTSPFGNRRNPFTKGIQNHAGIDLAAPQGTKIHVTADGVVVYAGWYSLKDSAAWWRYGNLVAIAHGNQFITLYGHCDQIQVTRGQRVRQGEVIATVGNTGWSTSPHLHYEVRRASGGEFLPVDPRIYILDHRWRDEEGMLVRARSAPENRDFEPLPSIIAR